MEVKRKRRNWKIVRDIYELLRADSFMADYMIREEVIKKRAGMRIWKYKRRLMERGEDEREYDILLRENFWKERGMGQGNGSVEELMGEKLGEGGNWEFEV